MMQIDEQIIEKTELEFREGTSDKVYIAAICKIEDGYQVRFSYGRRGHVANHSYEPHEPTTYGTAQGIYQKKINQKIKKGYTER